MFATAYSQPLSSPYAFRVARHSWVRYRRVVLVDCLLEHAEPGMREALAQEVSARRLELEEELRAGIAEARVRWPKLHLENDDRAFVRYLASRLRGEPSQAMARIQYCDLALARACADGDSAAIDEFQQLFSQDISRAIARFAGRDLPAEDLRQHLLERLFVASDKRPPRIASYGGQGHLQNWLRVTSVRLFVDLLRKSKKNDSVLGLKSDTFAFADKSDSPELQLIKDRYHREFKEAFAHALVSLEPAERNMLRWRHIHGLSVNEIAAILRIHRVTATQRLKRIRQTLHKTTLVHVQAELQLGDDSLDGFFQVIQSNLDASVSRILGSMEAVSEDQGVA